MAGNAAFDFGNWHAEPECLRTVVACHGGVGVMLVCLTHGKACELEATGGGCSILEAASVAIPGEGLLT